jgi:hypothetical protein
MKLQGINGTEFGLEIVDYEFPDLASADEMDLNWLLIHITAKDNHSNWDVIEPCLDVIEAMSLCKWFERLSQGSDEPPVFVDGGFMEPELMLDLVASTPAQVTIQVKCRHQSVFKNRTRLIRSTFLCEVTRTQLKQAALEWGSEIQEYPARRKPRT